MFPKEFEDVLQNYKQLENISQKLYDMFLGRLDDSNKAYFWPALTALLIISNDKMEEADFQLSNPVDKRKGNKRVSGLI